MRPGCVHLPTIHPASIQPSFQLLPFKHSSLHRPAILKKLQGVFRNVILTIGRPGADHVHINPAVSAHACELALQQAAGELGVFGGLGVLEEIKRSRNVCPRFGLQGTPATSSPDRQRL